MKIASLNIENGDFYVSQETKYVAFPVKSLDIISVMRSADFEFNRKEAGRIGEKTAAEFLSRKGFIILDRNYRKPWGEIDIIAEKEDVVRFIEVKTKTVFGMGNVSRENGYRPEEQAHGWKLQKVARTAELYMNASRDVREYQIDVIGVLLDRTRRIAHCRLFEQVL